MKKETKVWVAYAEENHHAAQLLLDNHLYNACLQNIQQAIEKYLKAILIEHSVNLLKTHSVRDLSNELKKINVLIELTEDEIDLIDSIYIPSKYPAFSVLPEYSPSAEDCAKFMELSNKIQSFINKQLN